MAAAFKRAGLHKLECECGSYVYATVSALETYGLPACGCGQPFEPLEVELAFLLGVEDCYAVREYRDALSRKLHGQAPHVQRGRTVEPAETLALADVVRGRRERARSDRLQALRPAADPMPF